MLALATTKEEALAKLHSARKHLATIREKGEATMERTIMGAEVLGGAAAVSYYMGKNGGSAQIMGYDVDLAAGVVGVAAGILELGGKHSDHLFNIGVGCLRAFVTREATMKGQQAQGK